MFKKLLQRMMLQSQKSPNLEKVLFAEDTRDRQRSYPSTNISPGTMASIFTEAETGETKRQIELYEEMEEKDPHLASVLHTRKVAVSGMDYEIIPVPGGEKTAEFVRTVLDNIVNLTDGLNHILDAIGKGYSLTEIIWERNELGVVPTELKPIMAKRVCVKESETPKIYTDYSYQSTADLPPGKTIFHRSFLRSTYTPSAGLLRTIAWMWLFKIYSMKFWNAFNEIFGMPVRIGRFSSDSSEEDKEALKSAVLNIGIDSCAVISDSTNIEFVGVGDRLSVQANPFAAMIEFCNREMSKAVLGQTLTTDTSGATGTYSTAKVHNRVRQDIAEYDSECLAVTLNNQLIKPIVLYNFGQVPIPKIRFYAKIREDLYLLAQSVQHFANAGYRIDANYLTKMTGILFTEDIKDGGDPNA